MKASARRIGHAGAMDRTHSEPRGARRTPADPRLWAVLALALVFLSLGALFLAARAIGARDAALALYLAGLALFSTRRAVAIVLGASLVIPACDLVLVAGTAAGWQLALHALSAGVLALTALWVARPLSGTVPGE